MGQAALKPVDMEQVLDVSSALDVVSEYAAEGRKNREISKEAIEAIRKTGYFRSFLPKQYGGLERPPQEFFKASVDIAERDMGTAWASGIIAVHAYQLSLMEFLIKVRKIFTTVRSLLRSLIILSKTHGMPWVCRRLVQMTS